MLGEARQWTLSRASSRHHSVSAITALVTGARELVASNRSILKIQAAAQSAPALTQEEVALSSRPTDILHV